jgi:hypothetical protein
MAAKPGRFCGRFTTSGKNNLTKTTPAKKNSKKSSTPDQDLREHLLFLLRDGGAHAGVEAAVAGWPMKLVGVKVAAFPHSAWMLLEHLRIAQHDILAFSRTAKHVSPPWPEGYWPETESPPSDKAWKASVGAFKKDLRALEELVANPKTDLYARLPWGDGQTVLREALLVADHNAYHLGQLFMLRKCLGI